MTASSEKKCNRCGEVKSTSFFYRHKLAKDGLRSSCKLCCKSRNKAYYADNHESLKAYAREYHEKNRESCREKMRGRYAANKEAYRAKALDRSIGQGAHDFYQAEIAKSDKCRICRVTEADAPKGRLAVDHCHATGEFRGLLCSNCNTAIGLLQDDISNLTAAIEYLRQNK